MPTQAPEPSRATAATPQLSKPRRRPASTLILRRPSAGPVEEEIVAGVMTNPCCETTARDTFVGAFRVLFSEDVMGTERLLVLAHPLFLTQNYMVFCLQMRCIWLHCLCIYQNMYFFYYMHIAVIL